MNLAAIILGVVTCGLAYKTLLELSAPLVSSLSPTLMGFLALALELVAVFVAGAVTARLSGLERKRKRSNAGIMALLVGGLQIAANGGGLHLVRFFVLLLYVPVALWGAGKAPWRGRAAS